MKHIVSISLGSAARNHQAIQQFGDEIFCVERIGTDGDKARAIALIKELDGKVDAFGLGGTDLYIYAGNKKYTFRESEKIAAAAEKTPIVDGSGIKNTLERSVVNFLEEEQVINFKDKKVLLVCGVDRFGLAEALTEAGCRMVFGDLMFGMGVPLPIYTLSGLSGLARVIAPVITKLPIAMFYPIGSRQNEVSPRFGRFFQEADIIAGDFHYIRRYMPHRLRNKTIITNTVTKEDENFLKEHGINLLITTTPEIGGRSFGTNILEGMLVAATGKKPEELTAQDYEHNLKLFGIKPRIKNLL
ncbi:MAG: quinate 5-dehydrogenase [Pelosinus sp.]|nr:quinate 5-dehydrogenase [Pelosinus sp.]